MLGNQIAHEKWLICPLSPGLSAIASKNTGYFVWTARFWRNRQENRAYFARGKLADGGMARMKQNPASGDDLRRIFLLICSDLGNGSELSWFFQLICSDPACDCELSRISLLNSPPLS
ncbi:hypothetical protein [Paenibacillus cymbidii]|uniref:hypothetical protein n=1 Tax=Paenibacillus cymbidii TaxID=1639034 RepID=UPI001081CCED|nr:hypothetical protein [Paenibacillus cymbidii]